MNKKAFFSVVLLVFAFLVFIIFANYNKDAKEIYFDDSPRYFALKTEDAYSVLDIQLAYDYVNYKSELGPADCNTIVLVDPMMYSAYLTNKYSLLQINKYCTVNFGTMNTSNVVSKSFDANITTTVNCIYDSNSDLNMHLDYSKTFTFKKQYKSYTQAGKCLFQVYDYDAKAIQLSYSK